MTDFKCIICVPIRWFNAEAYYGYCIAKTMLKNGHDTIVYCRNSDPIKTRCKNEKIPVKKIPGMFRWLYSFFTTENTVFFALNGHAHFLGMLARIICPSLKIIRIRAEIRKPSKSLLNRFLYSHTDHIICGAEFIKNSHLKNWNLDNVSVIYCPIDTEKFLPENQNNEKPIIGMVARFDPVKGHETAFKALQHLSDPQIKIYGYEANFTRDDIASLAEKYGISAEITDKKIDVSSVLHNIDIGLIASQGSEANCRILLEFMASGIPVVTTAVGVIPEIIHNGRNGFIAPKDKHKQLGFYLEKLLGSPELRKSIADEALKDIKEKFSLQSFYQILIKTLSPIFK